MVLFKRCILHTCSFHVAVIQLYYLQSSDRITLGQWPGALWPPSSWNRRLLEESGHGGFKQAEKSGENGLHMSHSQEPNDHPDWVSEILYGDETKMQKIKRRHSTPTFRVDKQKPLFFLRLAETQFFAFMKPRSTFRPYFWKGFLGLKKTDWPPI